MADVLLDDTSDIQLQQIALSGLCNYALGSTDSFLFHTIVDLPSLTQVC